jgi:hypothetical protein
VRAEASGFLGFDPVDAAARAELAQIVLENCGAKPKRLTENEDFQGGRPIWVSYRSLTYRNGRS